LALVVQQPSLVRLLVDFNAHYTLWVCPSADCKDQETANFLFSSNLCLLKDKTPTCIHPATGSESSVDLAMCDPVLYLDYDFSVYADSCSSDHFLVILKAGGAKPSL
jgi:Endonuclease-reverse transcriptase